MSYHVLVADGHWLIRRGLLATLQQLEDYEVVGEAANTRDAVMHTIDLKPDVVLVDVKLPEAGGIAALRTIKERHKGQKVLLLSDHFDEASIRDALRAGCDGYVRKDGSHGELLDAIRCVRGGKVYLDAEMTRQMVLSDYQNRAPRDTNPLDQLTPREQMVFRLVGAGCTNRMAGASMHLSPKTVEKYRAKLMQKLNLRSALDLRLLALELGVGAPGLAAIPAAGRGATSGHASP
jgi:DNA-binding NarL/FixJ family response regulator